MTIYIDKEYRCYTDNEAGRRKFEVAAFDGKCRQYIEGYRYIPESEQWTREDGVVFNGIMVSPAVPYSALIMAQEAYEEAEVITRIITGEVSINDES